MEIKIKYLISIKYDIKLSFKIFVDVYLMKYKRELFLLGAVWIACICSDYWRCSVTLLYV